MSALGFLSAAALAALLSAGVTNGLDEGALVRKLSDSSAKVRRGAVKDLAELQTESAWEAIVEKALADPEARVADEAQWQLGGAAASEALFEALGSKKGLAARTPLVRERAAEALGRIDGAVPIELFASVLKDKEPSVRAAAAYALELRASRGAAALDLGASRSVSAVRKALSKSASGDRDPRARGNAIVALSALGVLDEEARELASKVIDRDHKWPAVRAASLLAARASNTVEDLTEGLLDSDCGVAMVSLRLLSGRGDAASMQALSAALPEDGAAPEGVPSAAVTAAMVTALREASGLSHGAVRARWQQWSDDLDPDWSRKPEGRRREENAKGGATAGSTTFYGLRLASERLVFLVDMSGSMWQKAGSTSRKEQVDLELAKALRGLPATASFNVVPYATEPGGWEDGLVPATERNVEKAIQWFERNKQRGKGDLWQALIPVLRDPSVDTVVILSDGAPSGGDRWNIELMQRLLQDENRLRGVVIHAVMFDASGFLKGAWKKVVEDWGGAQQLID